MKKVLALSVASLCALGLTGGVSALQMTSNTEDIPAEYNVNSAYAVTIPASITFNGTTVEESVTASNVLINDGETLKVSMSSANGKLQNGENSYIPYSFAIGETTTTITAATDYELLSIESGNKTGGSAAITFTANDLSNVNLSGMHSDTLTFKVNVNSGEIFMQDINGEIKAKIASGEITSLKDERDSKEYTIANIAGTTWMIQNLANTSTGATWENAGIYVDEASGNVYYNWGAAMDACPDGWKLPKQVDFNNLIADHSTGWLIGAPFNGTLAGAIISGELRNVNDGGCYWTATEDGSDNAYFLDFGRKVTNVSSVDKALVGLSVRCIAE